MEDNEYLFKLHCQWLERLVDERGRVEVDYLPEDVKTQFEIAGCCQFITCCVFQHADEEPNKSNASFSKNPKKKVVYRSNSLLQYQRCKNIRVRDDFQKRENLGFEDGRLGRSRQQVEITLDELLDAFEPSLL